jgi:hypothetical protein
VGQARGLVKPRDEGSSVLLPVYLRFVERQFTV